ncbi:chemotaxis protein [Magnetococcales bacterium HHB-1]
MSQDDLMAQIEQRANLAFSNEMEMLTFYLNDNQLYGLNVFKIIEILECPKEVTRIPQSHPAIVGSIDFRGSAISLMDLSAAVGLPPTDYKNTLSYVLVCEYSTSIQGFLITQPDQLLNKSWSEIRRPTGNIYNTSYLTAISYHNDQTIQILDVEKVLCEIIGIDDKVSEKLVEKGKAVRVEEHQVLAVDDSKAALALLKSSLNQLGIKHKLFDNAADAWKELDESCEANGGISPYTMVISDIEMPVMDGFTFTRKVKGDSRMKNLYLVLHSSLSNKSNQDKASKVGADDFIPKFQPNKLIEAVVEQVGKAEEKRAQINGV